MSKDFKKDIKKDKAQQKDAQKKKRLNSEDSDSGAQDLFQKSSEPIFELGGPRKKISVGTYMNKVNVNIREYFQRDDEWLPTKKGITLNVQQWAILKKLIPEIDEAIENTK